MNELRRTMRVGERDGVPMYACVLPRNRESAPLARKLLTKLLTEEWQVPSLVDDAGLVLDELVANAAEHARGTSIRIVILRTDVKVVRVAVVDGDRREPKVVAAGPEDEGGRGLRLIEELSQKWGVDPYTWGKSVWADMGGSL